MINIDKKIIVSRIPPSTKKSELINYFSKFGSINHCNITKVNNGNHNKGFIIGFQSEVDTNLILEMQHRLNGTRITVKPFSGQLRVANQRKVFVSNLPVDVSPTRVKGLFETYGKVRELKVSSSGRSGYITFEDPEVAREVLSKREVKFERKFTITLMESSEKENCQKKLDKIEPVLVVDNEHKSTSGEQQQAGEINTTGEDNLDKPSTDKEKLKDQSKNKKLNKKKGRRPGKGRFKDSTLSRKMRNRQRRGKGISGLKKKHVSYFTGEFFPPEKLKNYLCRIYNSNPQVKNIPKKKLRTLQLFYFNHAKRNGAKHEGLVIAYYTIVGRVEEDLKKNHKKRNLRMNYVAKNEVC